MLIDLFSVSGRSRAEKAAEADLPLITQTAIAAACLDCSSPFSNCVGRRSYTHIQDRRNRETSIRCRHSGCDLLSRGINDRSLLFLSLALAETRHPRRSQSHLLVSPEVSVRMHASGRRGHSTRCRHSGIACHERRRSKRSPENRIGSNIRRLQVGQFPGSNPVASRRYLNTVPYGHASTFVRTSYIYIGV